ncbi:unnamed protein product [Brachionus calyciflorus]|uniref:Beta-1,4-galactosyltransferase n=1 Tax=Brachionus calyciflorus TaxID=104777 RepID=A0A814J2N3_9BILA|nr:unnamed protein product [Brachionus calyciflorus]
MRLFRFRRKNLKRFFYLTTSINLIIVFAVIYHEKIFNTIDFISIPFNSELCRFIPFNITSKSMNLKNLTLSEVEGELSYLSLRNGGKWSPLEENTKKSRVAIIVPYRNRRKNLHIFLLYMHKFLTNQNIDYGIYLVEPLEYLTFNRALLINIGYLEALKEDEKIDCFIFHDVDMLPENTKNIYECDPLVPKQMAVAINTYSYSTDGYFKERYFGGINAFTRKQFENINGFSNSYYGWGIEDDDARLRVLNKYSHIARQDPKIGRYFANCHEKQSKNPNRFVLYMTASSRMETDGLNSMKYRVIKIEKNNLFTRLFVTYKNDHS